MPDGPQLDLQMTKLVPVEDDCLDEQDFSLDNLLPFAFKLLGTLTPDLLMWMWTRSSCLGRSVPWTRRSRYGRGLI